MSATKPAIPFLTALLGLALAGCPAGGEDDDLPGDDDAAGDDDTAGADDDTWSAGELVAEFLVEGVASLDPEGDPQTWTGSDSYAEWIEGVQTCDIEYVTTGTRTDACAFCEFTFDVTYAMQSDDSVEPCFRIWAPEDGESVSLGYYDSPSGGLMYYYVADLGWSIWGYGTAAGDTVDYYWGGTYVYAY